MLNPEIIKSTEPLLKGNLRDSTFPLPFSGSNENSDVNPARTFDNLTLMNLFTVEDSDVNFRNTNKRYKN